MRISEGRLRSLIRSLIKESTNDLSSNIMVKNISHLVGDGGRPNGTNGWNWFAQTKSGESISLYYQEHMGRKVEVKDPPKSMIRYTGRPDEWGIVYISLGDLSYFF